MSTLREIAQRLKHQQRWLTLAGNRVAYPVANGATSVVVTLKPEEFNDQYGVIATPSWGTTVYVTGIQVDQFTINFGTASPDANQVVHVATFREE